MTTGISIKTSGFDRVLSKYLSYSQALNNIKQELPDALARDGAAFGNSNSSVDVSVDVVHEVDSNATVRARGLLKRHETYNVSSACLEEFGYGIAGKGTYNRAVPLSWIYDMNNHGEAGWFYRAFGMSCWSNGEPAKGYMKQAAELMRGEVEQKAKELFK